MVVASCDCGAVRVEIDAPVPDWVWDCPCTICQKLGVLWAYYHPSQVRIVAEPDATSIYLRNKRILEFHSCRVCACTTHWITAGHDKFDKMGVNSRLMDPAVRRRAETRRPEIQV